ncbi:MAG: TRAP transporter substrate-binding protein [candidate division NC10 bacterium]
MMKKRGMFVLVLALAAGAALGWTLDAVAGTTITMKAGIVIDQNHPYYHGIAKFNEIIGQKTNGRLKVEIYHSSQLGNERDLVEGLSMGSVDLAAVSSAPVSSFVPKIAVFDLPYLFTSRDQAYKVMDGPIGQGFFKDLEAKSVIGLAYFENGFRNITNSKRPINAPADMKGIKIRVMESPVPIATFNTIGANATPMAWGEVFTALQQKTIDAQENPMPVIYTQKLFEVQKYLSMTEHFYAPALFLMSKAIYGKLSPEEQKIVREAAKEAATYERQVSKQQAEDFVAKCKEKGMVVNEVNKKVWQEAMAPVYAKFEGQLGKELIEAIKNTK